MDDLNDWPPERKAQLNAHIARLRGWREVTVLTTNDVIGLETPDSKIAFCAPKWADGVRETWDLQREGRIDVHYFREGWRGLPMEAPDAPLPTHIIMAPDPAIAVCLAYLVAKGKEFEG